MHLRVSAGVFSCFLPFLVSPLVVISLGPQAAPSQGLCWAPCSRLYDRWQATNRDVARDTYYRCVRRCAAVRGNGPALTGLPGDVEAGIRQLPAVPVPPRTVGVLLPADLRAGETFSGTVIADVHRYDSVPGVRVIALNVPVTLGSDGEALIESLAVHGEDGDWPASVVFTGRVPAGGNVLPLEFYGADVNAGATMVTVPLRPPGAKAAPAAFETPVTCSPGSVSLVRGVFDGEAATTHVNVSGLDAELVAESVRAAFWIAPPNIRAGANELSVTEGGTVVARRDIAALRLRMSADDLDLRKGQRTAFRVAVEGLGAIPQAAWRGGILDELASPNRVAEIAPDQPLPGSGDPGIVLLHVENTTHDIVTIEKSRKEALVFAIERRSVPATGTFEYRGVIKSKKGGRFGVSGLVVPLLAPYTTDRK